MFLDQIKTALTLIFSEALLNHILEFKHFHHHFDFVKYFCVCSPLTFHKLFFSAI